jgi:transcriptional regulator with PAS, ATPase and Fis domain
MPVLVTGETGVGKEMLARHVHALSGCGGRFVPLNCAAIPSTLMESEVFGYTKGAFTGASEDKEGLFLAAHQGTLFLDEVGSLPLEMQAKLLRVLEEGRVRPLGSTDHVVADVRLICATNSDLRENVARRSFREDLFYRINAVTLSIPPLRERREDIPVLLEYFLRAAGRKVRMEKSALAALVEYGWPGNVRELKNEVARLLAVAGDIIEKHMLRTEILHPQVFAPTGGLAEMERKMIQEVLKRTGYNKQKTAKILGISRTTLYEKIKRYRLEHTES